MSQAKSTKNIMNSTSIYTLQLEATAVLRNVFVTNDKIMVIGAQPYRVSFYKYQEIYYILVLTLSGKVILNFRPLSSLK